MVQRSGDRRKSLAKKATYKRKEERINNETKNLPERKKPQK